MQNAERYFSVVGAFDTETTTFGTGPDSKALPCLYVVEDIAPIGDISNYRPELGVTRFYRLPEEFLGRVRAWINYGRTKKIIPVVCAYNLAFDLQTVWADLAKGYRLEITARSGRQIYTLDLCDKDGFTLLRFWDVYHLETNGLAAMGRAAGIPKLEGSWDYGLIRTPGTELTEEEKDYAAHDVKIILAYLANLLRRSPWLTSEELGSKITTKTSTVRVFAARKLAGLKVGRPPKRLLTLHEYTCYEELPYTYESYATRKACFRGGLAITPARHAFAPATNVTAYDTASMHHACINGRFIPRRFNEVPFDLLRRKVYEKVRTVTLDEVLANFAKPLPVAFHARIRYKNLRLKEPFASLGLGILSESKFFALARESKAEDTPGETMKEDLYKAAGFRDEALGATFALGKLISAKSAAVYLTELEAWNLEQVYEYDSYEVEYMEATSSFMPPLDYISLQSNLLYDRKKAAKEALDRGDAAAADWYQTTLKGMYNSIYGTQAQDLLRPRFAVIDDGELIVDPDSVASPDTYDDLVAKVKRPRSLYTWGMRIAGSSRMHMVQAILVLHAAFGDRVQVLGGDTDSLYLSHPDVSEEAIEDVLAVFGDIVQTGLDEAQRRLRENFPELASDFAGLGAFEWEGAYREHVELGNKARISIDYEGKVHLTMAGVSRRRQHNIMDYFQRRIDAGESLAELFDALGYNLVLDASVSGKLERVVPAYGEEHRIDEVTDYAGNVYEWTGPAAVALYPAPVTINDDTHLENLETKTYLAREYGRYVNDSLRLLKYDAENDTYTLEHLL